MRSLSKSSKLIPIVLLIALGGLNGCFRSPFEESTLTPTDLIQIQTNTTPSPAQSVEPFPTSILQPEESQLGLILVIAGFGLGCIALGLAKAKSFSSPNKSNKNQPQTTHLKSSSIPLKSSIDIHNSTKFEELESRQLYYENIVSSLKQKIDRSQKEIETLIGSIQELSQKLNISSSPNQNLPEAEKAEELEKKVTALQTSIVSLQVRIESQDEAIQNWIKYLQLQLEKQSHSSNNSEKLEAIERLIVSLQNKVIKLQRELEIQPQISPASQILSQSTHQDPLLTIIDRFQRNPKDLFESGERIKALKPDQEPHLLTLTPKQSSPVALIRVSGQGGYLIPKPGYNTYAKFEPYFALEGFQKHGDLQLLELAQVSPLRDRWMLEKKGKICFNSL